MRRSRAWRGLSVLIMPLKYSTISGGMSRMEVAPWARAVDLGVAADLAHVGVPGEGAVAGAGRRAAGVTPRRGRAPRRRPWGVAAAGWRRPPPAPPTVERPELEVRQVDLVEGVRDCTWLHGGHLIEAGRWCHGDAGLQSSRCANRCAPRTRTGVLFAKTRTGPLGEVQLVAASPAGAPAGGPLSAQYLSLPDPGSHAAVLARPVWLWGAEHGVNERRVAVGNQEVWTTAGTADAPAGLLGMDLVRLALERASTAAEGVAVITELVAAHGQGGAGTQAGEAYDSSFLVADPDGAPSCSRRPGVTWAAAKEVEGSAALSNRLSLGAGWTLGVPEAGPRCRLRPLAGSPGPAHGHADVRLAAGRRFSGGPTLPDRSTARGDGGPPAGPRRRTLGCDRERRRSHHARCRWWPPPTAPASRCACTCAACFATASSMVAALPTDPSAPLRAWVAPGSPCVSVYLPVFPPQEGRSGAVAVELADEGAWRQVDVLRRRCEDDAAARRRSGRCSTRWRPSCGTSPTRWRLPRAAGTGRSPTGPGCSPTAWPVSAAEGLRSPRPGRAAARVLGVGARHGRMREAPRRCRTQGAGER